MKMLSKLNTKIYAFILFLLLLKECVFAINVPVIIWSHENLQSLPSQSSLDLLSSQTFSHHFIEETKRSDAKLISIIQNKLSLEDFSTAKLGELKELDHVLESMPSYLLANVEDPVSAIEKNADKIHRIESMDNFVINPDEKTIIIELPPDNDLKQNDKIIGQLMHKLNDSLNGQMIMMLTGRNNSYAEEEIRRISRSILQRKESPKKKPKETGHLVNFDDCIFLYSEGGTINYTIYKGGSAKPDSRKGFVLPAKPSSHDGSCLKWDEKERFQSAVLTLRYYEIKEVKNFTITFKIRLTDSWWRVRKITASIDDKSISTKDLTFNSEKLEAAANFSFSCGDLLLKGSGEENLDLVKFRVNLKRFQLQPFRTEGPTIFTDSFDCTTFFTIPLWMGFFSLLLFIIIICIGVYLLSEIHTMDRFENPKGKTITVATTE